MPTRQRDKDFRLRCCEIYREQQAMGLSPDLREVVRRAIATPPPAFYVDSCYAYNKILRLLRNGTASVPASPAGCMWLELVALVRAELLRRPGSISRATDYVLNFRHPSAFHISLATGMRIARTAFEGRYVHRPRRGFSAGTRS